MQKSLCRKLTLVTSNKLSCKLQAANSLRAYSITDRKIKFNSDKHSKKFMQEKFQQEAEEEAKKREEQEKDIFYKARMREEAEVTGRVWMNFHMSSKPVDGDNIDAVRSRERIELEKVRRKYDHLASKFVDERVSAETKQKIMDDVLSYVNDDAIADDPLFQGMKYALKQQGISIGEKKYTEKELEDFINWLDSPESESLTKELDKVIPDDELERLGFYGHRAESSTTDAAQDLFRNVGPMEQDLLVKSRVEGFKERIPSAEIIKRAQENFKKDPAVIPNYKMDNTLHYLKKQAEKDPQSLELLEKEFGMPIDQILGGVGEKVTNSDLDLGTILQTAMNRAYQELSEERRVQEAREAEKASNKKKKV